MAHPGSEPEEVEVQQSNERDLLQGHIWASGVEVEPDFQIVVVAVGVEEQIVQPWVGVRVQLGASLLDWAPCPAVESWAAHLQMLAVVVAAVDDVVVVAVAVLLSLECDRDLEF